jgi:phage-related protein
MKPYFIWKGTSSLEKQIIVNKLPNIERPDANIEKITIEGRDGYLTLDDGTYQGTIKPCECSLDNGNIDEISSWLVGSSYVIFSNEPDKQYKGTIINKIPFSKVIPTFHTFIIQFDCQPHKYMLDNSVITLTTSDYIVNPGTSYSKPQLKIYGTGTIDITINETSIHLTNINEYVTIDSELVDCYKDTVLMNNNMYGEFPLFVPGSNSINWSGSVTKVEI